ncbi:heterokaryon incompatibility protein-domain-containing protein, partial [Stachybotrys elegans]
MRLLHTHTLRLESFDDDRQSPEYAILSHTWGEKEITFEDMRAAHLADLPPSPSLQKIEQCCSRARTDGFDYVWIDTCCIDKSSSAELSEAINSMFRWYQHSSVCYAYLQDFELPEMPSSSQVLDEETKPKFRNSRWFHRAWTLQELIAPWSVQFYDANWRWIGSRNEDLLSEICETTSISRDADSGRCRRHFGFDNLSSVLDTFAVSTRLSWAARRESTRVEDQAYSLLGLFNINMPLLYGEGVRAFTRLQRTIVQESRDQSILLW